MIGLLRWRNEETFTLLEKYYRAGESRQMKQCNPRVNVEVDNVRVQRHEFITLWLDRHKFGEALDGVQVELRVSKDGKAEIFTSLKEVDVLDFADWTDLPDD